MSASLLLERTNMFSRALCVLALTAVFAGVQSSPLKSWFPFNWGSKTSNQNLNWVVDEILKSVSNELIQEGGDKLLLKGSSLNTSEVLKVLWWQVPATVKSDTDGTLKNLSSVIRSSDAGILQEVEGGALKDILLKAELSLKHMEMEYPSVNVKVWFISYSGGMSVKCPDNVFDIAIQFGNGDSCPASVQSASIKSLSGCYVELAEGGVLNWIKQHILSFGLGRVVDSLKITENQELPGILTPIVQQHNLCKFLNPANVS